MHYDPWGVARQGVKTKKNSPDYLMRSICDIEEMEACYSLAALRQLLKFNCAFPGRLDKKIISPRLGLADNPG